MIKSPPKVIRNVKRTKLTKAKKSQKRIDSAPLYLGKAFPNSVRVKLTYMAPIGVGVGSVVGTSTIINVNDCIGTNAGLFTGPSSPNDFFNFQDVSAGGSGPYRNATVMASHAKLTFYPPTVAGQTNLVGGFIYSNGNQPPFPVSPEFLGTQKYGQCAVSNYGGPPVILHFRYNSKMFFGGDTRDNDDLQMTGGVTAAFKPKLLLCSSGTTTALLEIEYDIVFDGIAYT